MCVLATINTTGLERNMTTTAERTEQRHLSPMTDGGLYWERAAVIDCGPAENGQVYVTLRNLDDGRARYFYCVDNMKSEMLAVALTAVSTGFPVRADLEPPDEDPQHPGRTINNHEIRRMYVVRP